MKHVMVVDDSAVVRMALTAILDKAPDLSVAAAADPFIAMRKMKERRPDVIVLDLEMPQMDGLTFLRQIMARDPLPVVICSGVAARDTDLGLRALEEGAVDIITKPTLGVRDFMEESAPALVQVIRNAAHARAHAPRPRIDIAPRLTADAVLPSATPAIRLTSDKVVAIGASTGGTEALREILENVPVDGPGIVVVQHMPEVFTGAFAQRLDKLCRIEVKEAEDGDRILAGRALIAPGNKHLMVRRSGAHYVAEVRGGPQVSRHRPSVDVLFRSLAQAAGPNGVGVILTGMGDDGAEGLMEMRTCGAATIAQDEASSVIFGMPKEAIERGGVEQVVPLPRIAEAMLRAARRSPSAGAAG
jgi:two-component system chemotaxis response regulator CheB